MLTWKQFFQENYNIDFNEYFQFADELYQKARDKRYAVEVGFAYIGFVFLFRNASRLDKAVIETYEHGYKLGWEMSDMAEGIKECINDYRIRKTEFYKTYKNIVKLEFEYFLGIIPYKIKHFIISVNSDENPYLLGSTFEDSDNELSIVAELGKLKALIDLVELLKLKYIEHGGPTIQEANLDNMGGFSQLMQLKTSLLSNDLVTFFQVLQALFASLSYNMKVNESFFHSHIHLILKVLGFHVESEYETNIGRIDSVVESEKYIHIFEFKLNDASVAISQILEKKYFQRFLGSQKKIILVGVALDAKEKNISDWKMQSYN